jgi:hypothetical protein
MSFALLIIGAVMLIAAARGRESDLFALLRNDFTGPGNFVYWVISILVIGAIGYIPRLKPVSDAFLALIVIILFLTKGDPKKSPGGGFFEQFTRQIQSTNNPPAQTGSATGTTPGLIDDVLKGFSLPELPSLSDLAKTPPFVGAN